MPHPLEYVTTGAIVLCDKGTLPTVFTSTTGARVRINGLVTSNTNDKVPLVNILPFGVCTVKGGSPCTPTLLQWEDPFNVRVGGAKTLIFKSCIQCAAGGKINFLSSGQIPISGAGLEKIVDEHSEPEDDDSGWGWWDTAELIPVIGNVIGMVREAQKGNWLMVAVNAAFLVADIATFGTASAVTAPAKGALKVGVKYAGKTALKAGAKGGTKKLAKEGGEELAQTLSKKLSREAGENGKKCVTACFPAGTPVLTHYGTVPIESLQIDDDVYSFDLDGGCTTLQKIVGTIDQEVHATIIISIATEEIETTSDHPFYTNRGWIIATDLLVNDSLLTASGDWHRITGLKWEYQNTRVYNIEVEGLSNYYVGQWNWLVHNGKTCNGGRSGKKKNWKI